VSQIRTESNSNFVYVLGTYLQQISFALYSWQPAVQPTKSLGSVAACQPCSLTNKAVRFCSSVCALHSTPTLIMRLNVPVKTWSTEVGWTGGDACVVFHRTLTIKYDKTLQEAQLMQTNYVMLCRTQTVIQSISREDIKQS